MTSNREESHSRGLVKALVFVASTNVNSEEQVEILPRSIEEVKGTRVVRVSTGVVSIRQDRRAERAFVVRPTIVGRTKGVSVTAEPSFVMVHGPEQELAKSKVHAVETEPVQLARPVPPEGLPMTFGSVADVLVEAVLRMSQGKGPHEAVPHYLGHDRSRCDCGAFVVRPDDRAGTQVGSIQVETVHDCQRVLPPKALKGPG